MNISLGNSKWILVTSLFLILAWCHSAFSAPSLTTITIQGYMKLPAGAGAVTNGTYQIVFGVCSTDCTSTSNVLWVKKINTSVLSGLFSVDLSGAGEDLSADGTVPVGTNLRLNRTSATLNPTLIKDIASGAVVVRAYAASTINLSNPQFDISISSVPTAFYAGFCGVAESVTVAAGGTATIGNSTTTSTTIIQSGSGGISFAGNVSTANAVTSVALGGTGLTTLNLGGSSTSALTTTLGGTNTTSATNVQSGSGGVNINDGVNQSTNINTGSSTGAVNIASGATGGAISIGSGATTAQTITIGSDGAVGNTTILRGGSTNGVQINASINSPTNINTGTSSGVVSIATGTAPGAVNIGTGATTAQTITIGGAGVAGNTTVLRGGLTNGIQLNVDTNSPTNINTGTSTGAVSIATGNSAGAVNISTGTAPGAVNIGTGATTAQTITIGGAGVSGNTTVLRGGLTNGIQLNVDTNSPTNINTGTSTGAVTIGGSAAAQAVTVGGSNATATTAIRGTGGVTINGGTAITRAVRFGSGTMNAATTVITLTGLTAAHLCFASVIATPTAATVYPLRAVATLNTCTITWNATPSAGTAACLCI